MGKTLIMFIAALLCCGCGRGTISEPGEVGSTAQSPQVVINGFSEEPCLLTDSRMIRVGWYYDFSNYDSIRITFSATRISTERPFDEILIKIGPATYLRDTVSTVQKQVQISVKVSTIAKSVSCAFVFWSLHPLTELSLSNLRVIGWSRK
jgi:hypothetical protein